MSNVYRVGSLHGTEYYNTIKDANRCKPGGEEPESITRVNAAEECNRLEQTVEEVERKLRQLRWLLEELWDICPSEIVEIEVGQRVSKFIHDNPLPPATANNRDGQRHYGI